MILDASTLEIIREERKAKQTIMDIKFGPMESEVPVLAVASSDGRVYIHGTKKYDLLMTVEVPTRTCSITKIDFSVDGTTLRMGTNYDQLFYCTLQGGELINDPSLVRDQAWLNPSCPFAWFSQGT